MPRDRGVRHRLGHSVRWSWEPAFRGILRTVCLSPSIQTISSSASRTSSIWKCAVAALTLEEVLQNSTDLVRAVQAEIQNRGLVPQLELELVSLRILAVKPAPDIAKALEAESREALLRRADEAIYARRRMPVFPYQSTSDRMRENWGCRCIRLMSLPLSCRQRCRAGCRQNRRQHPQPGVSHHGKDSLRQQRNGVKSGKTGVPQMLTGRCT